jgi:2-amino-4-hydroxy-6-hydroxymethyldihydropteridine diphosphokinase
MSRAPRRIWLALGGNLGDRLAFMGVVLEALSAGGVTIEAVSSVYDTPPWGIEDQPRFANLAASAVTDLAPHEVLRLAKRIEAASGRDFQAPRNSARPVDIDLLLIEDEQVSTPDLVVPHAAMHERAFVLVPLAEIAPEARHPLLECSIAELCAQLSEVDRRLEVLAPRGWWDPPGAPGG